ncbi:MAG: carotenoid biosynthesis protein [Bacteroidia bacterium]|jgi:putative membrane protein|nr:carotenoid biosynthesis protein [Bacteroidia bacterium]
MIKLKPNHAIIILIILHVVGLSATGMGYEFLLSLTPLNLLISLLLTLSFHREIDFRFWMYIGLVIINGYIIEWAGVTTGAIFGSYFYGNNLGLKLDDVPLVIGVNWLILSYCSMNLVHLLFQPKHHLVQTWVIPAIGAIFMVFVDYWIEQVCSRLDFWYWKGQVIPLENYTAWFFFAFAFNFLFQKLGISTGNRVAIALYIIQLLFFIGLNVWLL